MRKIVLMMSTSLDGYIEGPDHDISWHRVDEELHQHFNTFIRGLGGLLSGRTTYELMAGYWPTADADPDASATEAEFAGIWREMPKIVYSRTLERADWNTTIVRDVVPEEVVALKEQAGGDLGLGGADLAAAFLRHDLVDELRVYVHPVLIGRGKPLFPHTDTAIETALRLTGSHAFGNGVALLRYERSR
ncbi:dihydrofolate reductase family protein [Streptomyces sp. IBSBF 2953]|uniref:dihydrofolate reductase family protein n=1 Tax=Streptomyces TaxID=1883 RepID=UPI00211A3C9E|nr:dihydrofolate reductase family protein [Streptomyces scabiei]MCQ9183625.1 dihydrofolate reductase family protein [Streptomyces hayashii]MDX3116179.1 dihydrofolate reductase family protein [Streptomyces scabiei]